VTANANTLRSILAKAGEKLAAAERELAAGFHGEASSRAYYSAFHAVTAALATQGLSFSSHGQTIGAFNREFVKKDIFPANMTGQLQRLFENRQTADYDWVSVVDEQTAEEDVAAARGILAACRGYVERQIQNRKS
jgi:uncharacterized protein (UPF0332 family)